MPSCASSWGSRRRSSVAAAALDSGGDNGAEKFSPGGCDLTTIRRKTFRRRAGLDRAVLGPTILEVRRHICESSFAPRDILSVGKSVSGEIVLRTRAQTPSTLGRVGMFSSVGLLSISCARATPKGSVPNQAALPTGPLLCLPVMFPGGSAVGYGRDSARP